MRTRKQTVLLLIAVVIVFLMAACGSAGETMDAAVMEDYGLCWLVAPLPVDPEINTFTMIELPKSDVPEGMDLHLGDNIRITYIGGILESGPGQFQEITAVEKIS